MLIPIQSPGGGNGPNLHSSTSFALKGGAENSVRTTGQVGGTALHRLLSNQDPGI